MLKEPHNYVNPNLSKINGTTPYVSTHCIIYNNPTQQEKDEMDFNTEIPDFEMETTPTSIQNVVKETQIDIAQRDTENKSPIIILQNTVSEIANLNLDVETVIKSEFPDFEIETTPTSIQYIAKAPDKISPEKHNDGDETDILTLGNPNFEVKEEGDIKTEITDFEIVTTPTTIQYVVATETEKFSIEEHLNGLVKTNVKRPYKCETCVIGFFSQKNYNEHMLCHMSVDNGPRCLTCDVTFATEQGFIMHCRITHDELEPVKEESITSEEEVEPTSNTVELIKVVIPPKKDNKLNLVKRSQANILQPYKCSICKRSFEHLKYLKSHEKVHTRDLKGGLKIHETTHTRGKPYYYKCNLCDKSYTNSFNLKRHERLHIGDKPYECNICAKRFIYSSNLKYHETIHTGLKPHKCNICTKRFRLFCHLKRHERLHTGEKPYKCNICDKRFARRGDLKRHETIHTGLKAHKCNICDKRFARGCDLKRHETIHTGLNPHKCNICTKRFAQLSHLKRHERLHTGEKPYKCNICDKRFAREYNLKIHETIHTGLKPR